ncbi:hypothetical protein CBR_g23700 [Chara braunii]|uniref:Uncharacterized protein n=1 Tax=Chara braunii TaxID=69332 RepID=A0A388L4X0_CHABU|nr:hypothetical protein CBR_g23700 [Chara braunii]|eukprot:GBG77369.1 hypothetical protein CBR_g23700 [Chara braunii]
MASMEMREANGGDCLSETASSGLAAAMEMTRKMGVSQAEGNGAKNDMSVDDCMIPSAIPVLSSNVET